MVGTELKIKCTHGTALTLILSLQPGNIPNIFLIFLIAYLRARPHHENYTLIISEWNHSFTIISSGSVLRDPTPVPQYNIINIIILSNIILLFWLLLLFGFLVCRDNPGGAQGLDLQEGSS